MKNTSYKIAGLALALMLAGCGGGGGSDSGSNSDDTPANLQDQFAQATIDATSNTAYTYFNLTTGETVAISDAEAETSTDWHIAFRRYNVKLNSGASGPGNVKGAVVAPQDDFYTSAGDPDANVFLNVTPDSELEHLLATYTAPTTLVDEAINTVLEGSGAQVGMMFDFGWYWYNLTNHSLSANDENGWLLRSGEGNSYARMRATDLVYGRTTGLEVAFEFDVQPAGASQFESTATFVASIPAGDGEVCFDFDTDANVACSGTDWDLKVGVAGRSFYLRSNGGASGSGNGAAFGPFEWEGDLDQYTSATTDPSGAAISFLYSQDSTGGVFVESDWYAYGLDGNHKLHPNYRVYWIDTDSTDTTAAKYAMQIVSYYNVAGASGYITLRWVDAAN
ncbi:MAG: HmuY family protein [Gammaproteobacteria bacterium]